MTPFEQGPAVAPQDAGRERPSETGEVPAVDVLRPLLARWKLVAAVALAVAAVSAGISMIIPHRFTATTTFVSERPRSAIPQALMGLAGQFGIAAPGEDAWSPQFYAQLARSRALLERILMARYAHDAAGDSLTLLEILGDPTLPPAEAVYAGLEQLNEDLAVTFDPQSNVIRLSVDAPDPELAAQLANRFVAYLGEFNTDARQSRAGRRRDFVEAQAADAQHSLQRAEEELRRFYETNRTWTQNSVLDFEEGRLLRQVELSQEVYLTLRRELETARIEEVNDTPVITVIDEAVPPVFRSWPRRKLIVAAALLAGLLAGALIAYLLEYHPQRRAVSA